MSAPGGVRHMARAGNTLYMAAGNSGVVAVNVTQPANAAVTFTLPVQGEAVDVLTVGSLIFVADSSGVRVFRTGETELPMLVAHRPLPGGASALALHGGLLLASNASPTDARLYVLDARRGDLPQLAPEAQLPLSAPARHIAVEGTRAFVSLGRAGQVAIVELTDPAAPAPAGTLVLRDELNQGWISAEQTLVAGDVVWVAGGGGKVQRFVAPVGQQPRWLETAAVTGDAKALARAGRYLMVGTLLLDVNGRAVEMPLTDARDAAGALAGSLVSVALDHLELRGTVPVAGAVVPVGVVPEVLLTGLPDMATAGAARLEGADGAEVRVARQARADTEGGRLALVPQSPLAVSTDYVLRVGETLADLGGRPLGTDVAVRFRTGPSAAPEQPVILSMAPATGLEAGGDTAVLTGEGFLPGCQVWVGDTLAQGVTVSADGARITLTVPPGPAGAAAVRVRNPNGLETLRLGLYRYLVPPELTQVSPNEAPFSSRQRVYLTGKGFAAATQVTFGGRPALSPVLDAQGGLSVEVPDDITGVVEVAVATPMPGGARVSRMPNGFTYTLKPLGSVASGAESLAVSGRVLLVARAGRLVGLDLTRPGDLPEVANVPGVTSAGGLVVVGDEAWLAGQGEVVRYALEGCGSGLPVSCPLQEVERIPLLASGLASVAAGRGSAYVTVAGGSEVVLLGRVGGVTRVVAQVDVGPGVVRGVAMAGRVLAVLVQGPQTGRLELRDVADGTLELVGEVSGLPSTPYRLAAEGTRVAVASNAGVRLYETADPAVPYLLGQWEEGLGRSYAVTLSGPWALASGDHGLAWLDTTQGLRRRTRSSTLGYASHVAVGAGVAVAATSQELRTFELPYPTISGQEPQPGATLPWGAAVSVTLADRLPPTVVQGTGMELVGSAGVIPGTRTVQGAAVLFRPSVPLTPGEPVQARVTLGATPYVGGTVLGPWTWTVLPSAEAPPLRVDAVVPDYGDVAGGYPVVLTGAGFDAQTQVLFGTRLATVVPPVSEDTLQVLAPASPLPGPVRLRLSQGAAGTPVDVPGGFVYVAPLALSRVVPPKVDLSGGVVTVEGTGFNRSLTARLDGLAAPVSDFTPTSFKVSVPPGPAGWLSLQVTQAGTPPVTLAQAVLRADSVPPAVIAWEPLDTTGPEQVPLNTVFTVRFSEPIDPATATGVRLLRQGGTVPEPGTHAVAADGLSVTFTPASPLPSTTAFRLTAAGVADQFGNAIVDAVASRRDFRSRDVVPPSVYVRLENSTQPLAQGTMLAAEVDWALRVVASDDSGGLKLRQLWVDGVTVNVNSDGKATYRWPGSMRSKPSTLRVRAEDNAGNSDQVEVTVQVVEDMPPTVVLTQPSTPVVQVEQGTSLTVALAASDNHSVSAVELRLDGAPIKRASGLSSPTATL
ncbi:MAG TPA: IPT/TIG domain-containing protein, partial [Myxococcaceae bacterium]